jgi:serine acetyltransferase
VIILKGIKIGDNTIVGAGSVVTHDIEANTIVAGNPAKVIGQTKYGIPKKFLEFIFELEFFLSLNLDFNFRW